MPEETEERLESSKHDAIPVAVCSNILCYNYSIITNFLRQRRGKVLRRRQRKRKRDWNPHNMMLFL